jgi:hypothetical protein
LDRFGVKYVDFSGQDGRADFAMEYDDAAVGVLDRIQTDVKGDPSECLQYFSEWPGVKHICTMPFELLSRFVDASSSTTRASVQLHATTTPTQAEWKQHPRLREARVFCSLDELCLLWGQPIRDLNELKSVSPPEFAVDNEWVVTTRTGATYLKPSSGTHVSIGAIPYLVVFDTTGAGDSFAGAFSAASRLALPLSISLTAAAAIAALSVTSYSTLSLESLLERRLAAGVDVARGVQADG